MAGQLWAVNSLGGFYYSLNLSKELRMGVKASTKFRQFCDVKDAWEKTNRAGQTFTWDTVPMMSRASRALTETNTVPQGSHTVLQGTLTMNERGFSVPYSGMLEAMSQFAVRQPIMKVLKYDASCDIDALAHQQFNATPLRAVSTSSADTAFTLTTNSTATATNTTLLSKINVRAIADGMRGRNIPSYSNGDYYVIARPAGLTLLASDIEAIDIYTETGLEMIMNGEIGRYWNCRFVTQTNVPRGGAADSTTFNAFTQTADAWDGSAGDWAFFFGEDTVAEAVNTPEEIRAKQPDDYGRSKGIAWYYLGGFGIVHTDATQARIVKYDSAA